MGMSASQARLLSITSRMNDIELRSQQISNTKIRLSDESEQVANDYNKALNATKLTYTTFNTETNSMQTVDLTPKNLSQFGYKLINRQTNEVFSGNVDAATMYEMIESGQYFIGEGGTETTIVNINNIRSFRDGAVNIDTSNQIKFSENVNNPSVTTSTGVKTLAGVTTLTGVTTVQPSTHTYVEGATEITVSGNTQMAIQSDDTNLAKAEAEYNAKTAKINSKEKKLDQQMKEMDTEHNALKTEYDSVKSLISDNISKSFQLFS